MVYLARNDGEQRVRENLSLAREHAKALRVALPELSFEVFKFIQQLPPSNGH
jgi:hypothetical protein